MHLVGSTSPLRTRLISVSPLPKKPAPSEAVTSLKGAGVPAGLGAVGGLPAGTRRALRAAAGWPDVHRKGMSWGSTGSSAPLLHNSMPGKGHTAVSVFNLVQQHCILWALGSQQAAMSAGLQFLCGSAQRSILPRPKASRVYLSFCAPDLQGNNNVFQIH